MYPCGGSEMWKYACVVVLLISPVMGEVIRSGEKQVQPNEPYTSGVSNPTFDPEVCTFVGAVGGIPLWAGKCGTVQ